MVRRQQLADRGIRQKVKSPCYLTFSVDVPGGQKFYQVSIGSRDPYVATLDEALAGLSLSIN